jgi:acetyl esterase
VTQAHPNIHAYRLTPQMRGVLERMERAGRPRLHTLTPEQAREVYALGADILEVPRAELERVQMLAIPARDGTALGARLVAPSRATGLPVLLYLHGGGFTIGSSATHDILCRELARLASCMVVSLDYRLAPEHRFPTASNDAWDALTWLAAHAHDLGADPKRIAVGGDSAGGTLATDSAMLARDGGLPLALQLLFYPAVRAQDTASPQSSPAAWLDEAAISWFFGQYVQDGLNAKTGAAPLLAPAWRVSRRHGSGWPNATHWWTRASTTPTSCAPPVCRWTWKSTAA